jgi:hypothetical protein
MTSARFIVLLPLLFFVTGCGASASKPLLPESATREPASDGDARQQVAQLEQLIARHRLALGLTERSELVDKEEAVAGEQVERDEDASKPEPQPAPVAPTCDAPAPRSIAEYSDSEEAPRQCPESCRLTRAICSAADRICILARYLDEEHARKRCRRARLDCSEARQATRSICAGC